MPVLPRSLTLKKLLSCRSSSVATRRIAEPVTLEVLLNVTVWLTVRVTVHPEPVQPSEPLASSCTERSVLLRLFDELNVPLRMKSAMCRCALPQVTLPAIDATDDVMLNATGTVIVLVDVVVRVSILSSNEPL